MKKKKVKARGKKVNSLVSNPKGDSFMLSEGLTTFEILDFKSQIKRAYIDIDRSQEDRDVVAYQKDGDMQVIDNVFLKRVPTIRIWANRYGYLLNSDDMFGELSFSFVKAVATYDKSKGAFNTWLYRIFLNSIMNIRNGLKAQKRRPLGSDPESISNFILSLDYDYNDGEGGSSTLKDKIANDMHTEEDLSENIRLKETIASLSCGDESMEGFLVKLSHGSTVVSLLKEYKTRRGFLILKPSQSARFKTRKCNRMVKTMIRERKNINDEFTLLHYEVNGKRLSYTIEMKKTEEADHIVKTLRKLKRNKDLLLSKMD